MLALPGGWVGRHRSAARSPARTVAGFCSMRAGSSIGDYQARDHYRRRKEVMARKGALSVVSTDLAQQWATRINRTMGDAVAAIIATGQGFIDAKHQLRHGGFLRLFANHRAPVADPVRCTRQTAAKLMAIATHPVLANVAHVRHLPPSWGTLYELTKVPTVRLERALADGRITPAMERRHVAELLGLAKRTRIASEGIPPLPAFDEDTLVTAFWRAARTLCRQLAPEDVEAFVTRIAAILDEVRRHHGSASKGDTLG
jgi:hypothetical protein